MDRRVSRRRVLAMGAAALPAMYLRTSFAQTPAAGQSEFPADSVPTIFGDVPMPAAADKVIAITDGSVDALFTLGITPVGVTASSNAESVAEYLLADAPEDLVYVGGWGELDLEQIVGLAPDVILGDRYTTEEQYQQLSAIAPVICPNEIEVPDADAVQQWEYEQLVWAHALGKVAEAEAAIRVSRDRAAGIVATLGDKVGQSVVVFRPQEEFPVVMSHSWITGRALTWSGMRGNEFTEALPPPHSGRTVSLEQLADLDAEWFFFAARDAEMASTIQTYLDNPLFQTLSGYQSGQMAQVDGALWSGATGVLALHAMLDDIERIIGNGEGLVGSSS